MKTPSSILVPVDLSPPSLAALERGVALARHLGLKLVLVSVAPVAVPTESGKIETYMEGDTRAELERVVRTYDLRVPVELVVQSGDAADVIVSTVRHRQPYLVVMATHGRGRFRRFLLGSVANKVLHDTECPVLTEPHEPERTSHTYRRVACALEFGKGDPATLGWAASFAGAFGAELLVLHAASGPEQWEIVMGLPSAETQMLTATEWRQRVVEDVGRRLEMALENSGVTGRAVVELGGVEETTARIVRARDADVLVIGRTHHQGLVAGIGEHTYALIRRSPCPVVSV